MASLQSSAQSEEEVHERLGPPAAPAHLPTPSINLYYHKAHSPKWASIDCISCHSSCTADCCSSASGEELFFMDSSARHRKDLDMVPFKWEVAPGLPIDENCCPELVCHSPPSLQLPPKLQCQGNQSPLPSVHNCQASHQSPPINKLPEAPNQSLFNSSYGKPRFERLRRFMHKTASCTRPLPPLFSHSWSHRPPSSELSCPTLDHMHRGKVDFHDRFFFDKHSPRDLRCSASMNSIIPIFDASDRYEDELVSKSALSLLAMEKHEDAQRSSDSSPCQPFSFQERHSPVSRHWQPASAIKIQSFQHHEDANDDCDSFQDFFSSGTSVKPSQRTDDTLQSGSSSPTTPWYLNFSPEEEKMHGERRGRRFVVMLVALTRIKGVIRRFNRKRGGANHHHFTESTMWSPTLATYLRDQQLEQEKKMMSKQMFSTTSHVYMVDEDGRSESGSNRLQINSNYFLPSTIRTHFMSPNQQIFSHTDEDDNDDENDNEDHREWKTDAKGFCLVQDKEVWNHNLQSIGHRLSLRTHLAEFDDDDVSPKLSHLQSLGDSNTLAGNPGTRPCKGMCKVGKTIKILVSTIKVFLIHTEVGKRRGSQQSV